MTTDTTTLTTWLIEQIAADEAVAKAALRNDVTGPPHTVLRVDDGRWSTGKHEMDAERVEGIGITIYDEGGHSTAQARHIATHDPARVLATCAAHRAIVERWQYLLEHGDAGNLEFAVRALASIYADRDGFDPRWAL